MNNTHYLSKWSKEKRKLKEFWLDKDGIYFSDGYLKAIHRMAKRYIEKYPDCYYLADGVGTPAYIIIEWYE